MVFWAYMIQCADRTFYVGHTNNLEQRLGEHQAGSFKGYTSTRRPVHLVWSQHFPSRYEAVEAERKLKGWRREKKLALIRGDWAAISALSRGSQGEGRASTSSARTMWGEAVGPFFLHPHPAALPSSPLSLEVVLRHAAERLTVRYRLEGETDLLRVPPRTKVARRDELWRHTCFELFAKSGDDDYLEFNFAPSTEWAAYRFGSYRTGMAEGQVEAPRIKVTAPARVLQLTAEVQFPPSFEPTRIGLSAVIEETTGHKSYWALAHPPGDTPDFHHPDCFAIDLSPAGEP